MSYVILEPATKIVHGHEVKTLVPEKTPIKQVSRSILAAAIGQFVTDLVALIETRSLNIAKVLIEEQAVSTKKIILAEHFVYYAIYQTISPNISIVRGSQKLLNAREYVGVHVYDSLWATVCKTVKSPYGRNKKMSVLVTKYILERDCFSLSANGPETIPYTKLTKVVGQKEDDLTDCFLYAIGCCAPRL